MYVIGFDLPIPAVNGIANKTSLWSSGVSGVTRALLVKSILSYASAIVQVSLDAISQVGKTSCTKMKSSHILSAVFCKSKLEAGVAS
jgi:hypothetical protein